MYPARGAADRADALAAAWAAQLWAGDQNSEAPPSFFRSVGATVLCTNMGEPLNVEHRPRFNQDFHQVFYQVPFY